MAAIVRRNDSLSMKLYANPADIRAADINRCECQSEAQNTHDVSRTQPPTTAEGRAKSKNNTVC